MSSTAPPARAPSLADRSSVVFDKLSRLGGSRTDVRTVFSGIWSRDRDSSSSNLVTWKNSIEEEEPPPDHQLSKWAVWIKRRKQVYRNLSKKSNQSPECLVENVGRRYEQILDKTLIEEAQRFQVGDKYRGHPKWFTTVKPKKECEKETIENLVYPANVKFDDDPNVIRNKCYFGVPQAIAEEQNLGKVCTAKDKHGKWEKSEYLAARKKELQGNIDVLEDFRPDIDNLYVKGKGLGPVIRKSPDVSFDIPEIVVTPADNDSLKSETTLLTQYLTIDKTILLIDNVPVGPGFPETDSYEWIIEFPLADLNEPKFRKVNFQNIGPSAIRFEWRPEKEYDNPDFPIRDYKRRMPRFHFHQRRYTILPGQQMDVEFMFMSSSNGLFREAWKFNTTPKVRHMPLMFVLQGIAAESTPNKDLPWSDIETYIQKWILDSSIQKILDEIERGITVPKLHAPYADLFGDSELFEFNNPTLHYRTREVTEMKELFTKVSDKRWNFSTLKLRNTILEAGLGCEDTIKYMNQLNHLVGELLHPPKEDKMERMKYRMVYTMLCAFFNQMGAVADRLLTRLSCQRLPNINTKYPPLDFEDPFERYMIEHVRTEPTATMSEKAYKKQKSKEEAGGRKSKTGSRKSQTGGRKSSAGRKSAAGGGGGGAGGGGGGGAAKKRQSAAGGAKKRQSAAGGGKRQSAAGGGKRQSAAGGGKKAAGGKPDKPAGDKPDKPAGDKPDAGKRKSASGGSRKSMGAGGPRKSATGSKKGSKSTKKGTRAAGYIWLTEPPVDVPIKLEFPEEADRVLFRGLLEAYTRDLLGLTLDKICAAVDTISTVEAGKEFDKDVQPVAYREHYKRPGHTPVLPALF